MRHYAAVSEPVEIGSVLSRHHANTCETLVDWLDSYVYVVQVFPPIEDQGFRLIAGRVAFLRCVESWSPFLFMADCQKKILPVFERERPSDERPRLAVAANRLYGLGEISERELSKARRAAREAAREFPAVAFATGPWDGFGVERMAARAAGAEDVCNAVTGVATTMGFDAWDEAYAKSGEDDPRHARRAFYGHAPPTRGSVIAARAREKALNRERRMETKRLFRYLES